jgi:hypothetical protein
MFKIRGEIKMSSKSKEVRIEQRRISEAKLALRLKKLAEKGISKEDAQRDSLVKNLKSKIRETNVRIAAFEKNIKLAQALAQAKAEKLAAPPKKKEKSKAKPAEPVAQQPKKQKEKHESHPEAAVEAPKKRKVAPADQETKEKPQPAVPVQAEHKPQPAPPAQVQTEKQPTAPSEAEQIPKVVKKPAAAKEESKEKPKAKPLKKPAATEKAPPKPKAAKKAPAKAKEVAPKKTPAKKATPKPKK